MLKVMVGVFTYSVIVKKAIDVLTRHSLMDVVDNICISVTAKNFVHCKAHI